MKRPGFTLTELLVVLPLIAVAGLLFTTILNPTFHDVPRLAQTLSRHRQVQNFLTRLQDDVDAASDLPATIGSATADSTKLLLQTPNGPLMYEVSDGKVIRKYLNASAKDEPFEWNLPEAKIEFQRWTHGDKSARKAYAVDVHTSLSVQREGKTHERFDNHRVFFLHAMPPETKAKP